MFRGACVQHYQFLAAPKFNFVGNGTYRNVSVTNLVATVLFHTVGTCSCFWLLLLLYFSCYSCGCAPIDVAVLQFLDRIKYETFRFLKIKKLALNNFKKLPYKSVFSLKVLYFVRVHWSGAFLAIQQSRSRHVYPCQLNSESPRNWSSPSASCTAASISSIYLSLLAPGLLEASISS